MSQQGAALQNYNNELVKCIEDLCTKRDDLQRQIITEEEEKHKLQNDIRVLSEKLAKTNEGLAKKTKTLILPSKVTLPSPIKQNSNFLNQDKPSKSNKYKNTSKSSNSSNGKQQIARGILWKTKKFF